MTRSSMDPLQWMGAVRMRVQTADQNFIVIRITPRNKYISQNSAKQIHAGGFWCKRQQEMDFFTCIMDLYFGQNHGLDVSWWMCFLKTHWFSLHWRTGVVWIVKFVSAGLSVSWHPFTAEDPLLSKWCTRSGSSNIGTICFSSSESECVSAREPI